MFPLIPPQEDLAAPARGCYAIKNGLSDSDDWEEGWMWFWRGRRNSIVTDCISLRVTNFSGHAVLVPKGGDKIISFGPRCKHSFEMEMNIYSKFAKAILQKDRQSIISIFAKENQHPGKLNRDCPCTAWALEAGISVRKVKVMYSPSRLKKLLDEEQLMSQCTYSWDVDIDKCDINCTTVFYVWDIVKDIPYAPMMKEFYNLGSSQSIALSPDDIKLAVSKLPMAEEHLKKSLIASRL